jgi:hypothetical protein
MRFPHLSFILENNIKIREADLSFYIKKALTWSVNDTIIIFMDICSISIIIHNNYSTKSSICQPPFLKYERKDKYGKRVHVTSDYTIGQTECITDQGMQFLYGEIWVTAHPRSGAKSDDETEGKSY